MGWHNPPVPWSEFERALSDASRPGSPPPGADGGDSPAWSRKRHAVRARDADQPCRPSTRAVPYAELHAHSNFSFLDGASSPEKLVEEAARLGLDGLALTDHDGLVRHRPDGRGGGELTPGSARLRRRTLAGAQQTAERRTRPGGQHLVVLARGRRATTGWPAPSPPPSWPPGPRRASPVYDLADLAASRQTAPGWCSPDAARARVRQALAAEGAAGATAGTRPTSSDLFGAGQRRRRALRPRQPAGHHRTTTPSPPSPPSSGSRSSPRPATCTTRRRRSIRSPRRSPPCGPAAASTSWTAGCRHPARAHLRSGAEMAAPVRPLPRRRRAHGRDRRRPGVPAAQRASPACRTRRCRRGTPR